MHVIIDAKTKEIIKCFQDSHDLEARNFLLKTNYNGRKCWGAYMTNEEYSDYRKELIDKTKE